MEGYLITRTSFSGDSLLGSWLEGARIAVFEPSDLVERLQIRTLLETAGAQRIVLSQSEVGPALDRGLIDAVWISVNHPGAGEFVASLQQGWDDFLNFYNVASDGTLSPFSPDTITGGMGDDTFEPGPGNHVIDGGEGQDTVIYSGGRTEFSIKLEEDGRIIVDKPDGTDTLISIERVEFDDGTLAFDIDSANLDFAYRIYAAAFGRTPDEDGLRFWADVMDWLDANDPSAHKQSFLAWRFLEAEEFILLYGENPSDFDYINAMYVNVLGREADEGGFNYWVGQMEAGLNRAGILIEFAESPENVAQTGPDLNNGVWVI